MNKEFARIRDDRPSPRRQPTGSWNGLGTNPLRRVFYCLRFVKRHGRLIKICTPSSSHASPVTFPRHVDAGTGLQRPRIAKGLHALGVVGYFCPTTRAVILDPTSGEQGAHQDQGRSTIASEASDRKSGWSWENPLRRVFCCLRKSALSAAGYRRRVFGLRSFSRLLSRASRRCASAPACSRSNLSAMKSTRISRCRWLLSISSPSSGSSKPSP